MCGGGEVERIWCGEFVLLLQIWRTYGALFGVFQSFWLLVTVAEDGNGLQCSVDYCVWPKRSEIKGW